MSINDFTMMEIGKKYKISLEKKTNLKTFNSKSIFIRFEHN